MRRLNGEDKDGRGWAQEEKGEIGKRELKRSRWSKMGVGREGEEKTGWRRHLFLFSLVR